MSKEVILVTGTSSGFGEMCALGLGRAGYIVYASMRETVGRNKMKADQYIELSRSKAMKL